MVPITGSWTEFSTQDERISFLRNWGLLSPKGTVEHPVMVVDGYFGTPEPCEVVGYQNSYTAVIKLADGYHAIFGEYLTELQPSCAQKLPRGMVFSDILANYIVLDIETTGFDRASDDIIEIAATKYHYGSEIDSFHTFIHPRKSIPEEIVQLTGISDRDVADAPEMGQISEDFLTYIGNIPLIGHNAISFDIPFLAAQLHHDLTNVVIDTLPMSKNAFPLLGCHKLEYLKKALELNPIQSHRADNDVRVTNSLLWACLAPKKYESHMWKAFLHDGHSRTQPDPVSKARKHIPQPKYAKVDIKSIHATSSEIDSSGPFYGKFVVFTGNLSMPRDAAMQLTVNAGGILKTAVSGKTSFLVVGEQDPSLVKSSGMSSKEQKALELNQCGKAHIQILHEKEFLRLIGKED